MSKKQDDMQEEDFKKRRRLNTDISPTLYKTFQTICLIKEEAMTAKLRRLVQANVEEEMQVASMRKRVEDLIERKRRKN